MGNIHPSQPFLHLFALGKRKAKAALAFPSPALGGRKSSARTDSPPKKILKKTKKSNKKKKRKNGRPARQLQPVPAPITVEDSSSRLDSVFLQLVLDEDDRFKAIRNFVIIKALKKEQKRFRAYANGPADKCPVDKLRAALPRVLSEEEDCTLALESPDHKVLCKLWLRELRLEIADLKQTSRVDRTHGPTPRVTHERSVVQEFFSALPKRPISPHPRGVSFGASATTSTGHDSPPPLVSFSDPSSSEFSSDASSEEEVPEPATSNGNFDGMVPLTLDEETKANLELLKECKGPEDLRERTANWVAKTTGLHLPSIMDMLQGKTPWPRWSQKRLFKACEWISHTYTQAEVRERLGDSIAEDARRTLLESEFSQIREIRMFLNLAQLGPGGSKDYLAKVTTETSRRDFEQAFHDPKAFKLFMRTLESVKAATSRSSRRRTSRSSSTNSSARRPQRRGRARRGGRSGAGRSRSYRPLRFRSTDRHQPSSSRGGGRGASRRSGSRYSRSNRGSNRRF